MKKLIYSLVMIGSMILMANAQVALQLKSTSKDCVEGEQILVDLTITNRTGHELVLTNHDNKPWISIDVTDCNAKQLLNYRILSLKPMRIPVGGSTSQRINLSQMYDLSKTGEYRAQATVRVASSGLSFISEPALISIRRALTIWSQSVGIPKGLPLAGSSCTYSVLMMNRLTGTDLYVRLDEAQMGIPIHCAKLGGMMKFSKPICKIDAQNRLHVLFMNKPDIFIHACVNAAGKFQPYTYFKRVGPNPTLVQDGKGGVLVMGGAPYDPSKKPDPIPGGDVNPLVD